MRVILDTNVFISAIFFKGPPYQILKRWHDDKLNLVISPEIFDEYQRVGAALSEQFPLIDLKQILQLVNNKAEMVLAKSLTNPVCIDPDDDKFLACAHTGKIKVIVSGDKHLLKVSGFREIRVLKPREFLDTFFLH